VQAAHRCRSSTGTPGTLLAQVPDLSVDELESLVEEHAAAAEGRMIGPRLASKLVVGGGVLLVVAALLPFTMTKKTAPKPLGNELTRWHSSPAPEADVAPGWEGGGGQTTAENSPTGGPTGQQRSVVVEAVSAGPGGNIHAPAWANNSPAPLAAGPSPAANNVAVPNLPAQMLPADVPPGYPAGDPRAAQAVGMNQPMALDKSAPAGQKPGVDGTENGTGPAAARLTGPAGDRPVYQADARSDPANAYRDADRGSPAPGVNPVMPDLNREFTPQGPGAPPPPPTTDLPPPQPSPAPQQQPPPSDTAQLDPIVPIPPTQDHP
jgi:hypothetical protein